MRILLLLLALSLSSPGQQMTLKDPVFLNWLAPAPPVVLGTNGSVNLIVNGGFEGTILDGAVYGPTNWWFSDAINNWVCYGWKSYPTAEDTMHVSRGGFDNHTPGGSCSLGFPFTVSYVTQDIAIEQNQIYCITAWAKQAGIGTVGYYKISWNDTEIYYTNSIDPYTNLYFYDWSNIVVYVTNVSATTATLKLEGDCSTHVNGFPAAGSVNWDDVGVFKMIPQ